MMSQRFATNQQRLITCKIIYKQGIRKEATLEFRRQGQFSSAIGHVIIEPTNTSECKKCAGRNSVGPFDLCISDNVHFQGACTNCQYGSTPSECSFYKKSWKRKAEHLPDTKRARSERGSSVTSSQEGDPWVQNMVYSLSNDAFDVLVDVVERDRVRRRGGDKEAQVK
ncbi:hypothetical protein CONLIGDRAFT_497430 [Coniochaeta ligniaria NRRL 30616]|uniref:Uncharacterized protein n=1 Tax=Coniochaeta ligniaria NRRL 30616 TaxID=1408157 RepID=A0A1J7ICR0_9PEZI|nr:hypothetical protein CONLIGDRAFT_497430 [Coniochaeta ligniaria NRRL 30616]